MMDTFFSASDIEYLQTHPDIIQAKSKLDNSNKVLFEIEGTESIRNALKNKFGLQFSSLNKIPMQWVKGDTSPHIDSGKNPFKNSYLIYITNSIGSFVIGDKEYSINENTGFIFPEGTIHKVENTNGSSRLMMGPINELFERVGAAGPITYYPSESDALTFSNFIAQSSNSYIVGSTTFGSIGSITSWKIASNSNGTSDQNTTYYNGQLLNSDGSYYLYPANPCFLEGTQILCLVNEKETYINIENINSNTLVKTFQNGYKKVELIGKTTMFNSGKQERTPDCIYKCSSNLYPELKQDLFITGYHSILVDKLTSEQEEKTKKSLGKLFITENKYRLMAYLDTKAEPWEKEGKFPIYHIALENKDKFNNYGVYANGLLVETCSQRYLKELSNMTLI